MEFFEKAHLSKSIKTSKYSKKKTKKHATVNPLEQAELSEDNLQSDIQPKSMKQKNNPKDEKSTNILCKSRNVNVITSQGINVGTTGPKKIKKKIKSKSSSSNVSLKSDSKTCLSSPEVPVKRQCLRKVSTHDQSLEDDLTTSKVQEGKSNKNIKPSNEYVEHHDKFYLLEDFKGLELTESSDCESDASLSSIQFDENGKLAQKIFKKLYSSQTNRPNRLIETAESVADEDSLESNVSEVSIQPMLISETLIQEVSDSDNESEPIEPVVIIPDSEESNESDLSETMTGDKINYVPESNESPPYESVLAIGTTTGNIDDVLGEYIYSTANNMPSHSTIETNFINKAFNIRNIKEAEIHESVNEIIPVGLNNSLEIDSFNEDEEKNGDEGNMESSTLAIDSEQDEFDKGIQNGDYQLQELASTTSTTIHSANNNFFSQVIDTSSDEEYDFESLPSESLKYYEAPKGYVVVMKHPCEMFMHGKVIASCLSGKVEVLGHVLDETRRQLFAPNYYCALTFRTIQEPTDHFGLFAKLSSLGLSVVASEEIVILKEFDVVLYLEPLAGAKWRFIENNFNKINLFHKPGKDMKIATDSLGCTIYNTKPHHNLVENCLWKSITDSALGKATKAIICGGKGTGKSTFLRYFVNRLQGKSPVLVLDFDPGQPEFTVPGCVSVTLVKEPLLGPNFTHLTVPDRCLSICNINVMDCAALYIEAVKDLINYCLTKPEYQNIPWVVNTMGMTITYGLKIILFLIIQLHPHIVVQIQSKVSKKCFEINLDSTSMWRFYEKCSRDPIFRYTRLPYPLDYEFFLSQTMAEENVRRPLVTPKEERYLNYLAYYGDCVNTTMKNGLLGVTPYEVSLKDIKVVTNVSVAPEAICKLLNGKIVALCTSDDTVGQYSTPMSSFILCHGHGLIRAVDLEKQLLYVITPCQELAAVNTVVYGDWVPDLTLLEYDLPAGTMIPYTASLNTKDRSLMKSPKRRFNPLQILRMRKAEVKA